MFNDIDLIVWQIERYLWPEIHLDRRLLLFRHGLHDLVNLTLADCFPCSICRCAPENADGYIVVQVKHFGR